MLYKVDMIWGSGLGKDEESEDNMDWCKKTGIIKV